MKKLFMFISLVLLSTISYAQVLKTVNVLTSGTLSTLLSDNEKLTITNLTLTGSIDDRDFITMRDKMPLLAALDLSAVTITAYSGIDGTYINGTEIITYSANELPKYAFCNNNTSSGKPRLKTIILPNSITSIGSAAFAYCTGITSLSIPNSITLIGSSAFSNCTGITGNLSISNYVTSIGAGAFRGCTGITGNLVIPSSVTLVGMEAFSSCTGLYGNLIIGNSVTTIQNYAFQYCYGISSLTIGSSLTSIGAGAFSYCSLKNIYSLNSNPPTLSSSAFTGINKNTCTLYVPVGSYTKYLTAVGWTDFINIIEGTSDVKDISNEKIKIYPNPVIEDFRISGIEGNATLMLTDIGGKILIEQMIQKSDVVPIGKLTKGVYFVKLITNEGVIEKKVIKN
jgi:hypothetical protein